MTTMHADLSTKAALAARLAPGYSILTSLAVCTLVATSEMIPLSTLTDGVSISSSCLA